MSGEWKGVMGDVINGNYMFSLNSWIWFLERDPLLDFVPVSKEKSVLTYIPKPPKVDYSLFIRPFRFETWRAIIGLIIVGILSFGLTHFASKIYGSKISGRIIMFFGWSFFVLVNAYYGGSLTMFFTTEVTLKFESIKDVLKAIPSWTLLFITGNEVFFESPASQGDLDYMNYVKLWEKDPERFNVKTIERGLELIKNDQTILLTSDAMLRGAHRRNPTSFPNVKTFAASSTSFSYLIFTKNSPLVPVFSKASMKSFERGQYERVSEYWQGQEISASSKNSMDTMVLTIGQVFLIFGVLMLSLLSSLVCLVLEIIFSRYKVQFVKSTKNFVNKYKPKNYKK